MDKEDNIYKAALQGQNILKLNKEERQKAILKLLETRTERQLAAEINIPHSTIHDWKTLRQDNTGKNIHISFSDFYRKLKSLEPEDITDWGRLEQIRNLIEELLYKGGKV